MAPSGVYHLIDAACDITEMSGHEQFDIIGVLDGHMLSRQGRGSLIKTMLPYFGEAYLSGSGAPVLYPILRILGEKYESNPSIDKSPAIKAYHSLARVPRYLLKLDDTHESPTITNGVGGYYEQYIATKNGLEPIDSVLTVFGSIIKSGNRKYIELRKFLFHCYISDWLVVASFEDMPKEVDVNSTTTISKSNMKIYKIPPAFESGVEPYFPQDFILFKMKNAHYHNLSLSCAVEGKVKELGGQENAKNNLIKIDISNKIKLSLHAEKFSEIMKTVDVFEKK